MAIRPRARQLAAHSGWIHGTARSARATCGATRYARAHTATRQRQLACPCMGQLARSSRSLAARRIAAPPKDERGLLAAQLAALNGKLSGQTGVEESLRAQNEQMKREIGAMQARARGASAAHVALRLASSLPPSRVAERPSSLGLCAFGMHRGARRPRSGSGRRSGTASVLLSSHRFDLSTRATQSQTCSHSHSHVRALAVALRREASARPL